jgi:hypothetical protein
MSNDDDDDKMQSAQLKRVTINLSRRTVDALESIMQISGLNRTDAINRAILGWNLLENHVAIGGTVYTCDPDSSEFTKQNFI